MNTNIGQKAIIGCIFHASVKTKEVQEDEKVEKQVSKQRWKLLLKLLNLQTTKQVMIRMILLSKVKMNTKHSIAILGTRAFL